MICKEHVSIQHLTTLVLLLFLPSACLSTYVPTSIPSTPVLIEIEEASSLALSRISQFSGKLTVEIVSAHALPIRLPDSTAYELALEAEIHNVSRDTIVLNKYMIPGFDNYPRNISVIVMSNGLQLSSENITTSSNFIAPKQESDFIELNPNEAKDLSWKVVIPGRLIAEGGGQVLVSGNTFEIYVKYENDSIGYLSEMPFATSEPSRRLSYIVDMNAWVGTLESNHIEVTFPDK